MPLRDDLLNPIPGDSPSGVNLRYDPITDKIKEARREDLDVPQGEWKTALKTADYTSVIKMASEAIANRGKDLQLAVWLVDAHVHKEGFALLAPGLQFLQDMLEQYWDTLYPPIDDDGDMEVRAAPLVWLGAKLGEPLGFLPIVQGKLSWHQYQESRSVGYEADADTSEKQDARETKIKEGKLTAEQYDEAIEQTPVGQLRDIYKQLNQGKEAIEKLGEYCDPQFGDFSPSFIKTRDTIEEIAQTVRIILTKKPGGLDEEPSALDEEFSLGLSSDVDNAPRAEIEAPAGEPAAEDSPAWSNENQALLSRICRSIRNKEPENPAAFLILRSYAFGPLMAQAPSIDASSITPPTSFLRMQLKRLSGESEWDKVIELTENAILQPGGAYWLDLHRYAINAVEQKGGSTIATVMTGQFRSLLEMLPDLAGLTFADDTPSANPETKSWIEGTVMAGGGGGGGGSSSDSSGDFGETPSFDTSSFDTPAEETPSFDTPSFDTPSFDTPAEETPSFDSSSESASEPAAAAEAEPDPFSFTLDETPPILEAETPPPSDISDEFGQALQAVRDGRTAEGLGIITAILATERSGRARFRRRTQLAHLLMAAGKGKVAQPLLDELAGEIESRRLEDWEPSEAIAYPLELLLHCLTSADEERREQLYARICKLDPVRAVNCLA